MAKKKKDPTPEAKMLEAVVEKISKDDFTDELYIPGHYDENHPLNVALTSYIRENKLAAYNIRQNVAEVSDGFIVASFQ